MLPNLPEQKTQQTKVTKLIIFFPEFDFNDYLQSVFLALVFDKSLHENVVFFSDITMIIYFRHHYDE